jgi:hypothetical protein
VSPKILLITPPFTQLNTPYPATPYLKGFLNTKNIQSEQADLGIEVILALFCQKGLGHLFASLDDDIRQLSANAQRILDLQNHYLSSIDPVISFLQGKNPDLSHLICQGNYLPEASRFAQLDDLEWAFGSMGTHDKARHLATLYLEDISDLIIESVDPHFGFSRYAERLARSASSFDELHQALQGSNSYIDNILIDILRKKIAEVKPAMVALSIPFPGNLYGALKIGQWLKAKHPQISIVLGGGYANTELRSLKETRIFEYTDFITLDDGEAPLYHLIEYLAGDRAASVLKRTFSLENNRVVYHDGSREQDYPQRLAGTPDYDGLLLSKYLSVIEIANPMHRLWSDGRWNKLTLAHGCYWGKCTFCDISLDYIQRYEPLTATLICDRIEQIITQTGQNGFHFVDEAAPPALLKALALEILNRQLTVVWWTNIRFEKSFTPDLCRLLAASGCIAISGGLEVASDRLLELINKGVTVGQVTRVADSFTRAGIMVHAYLMYGFPTQTAQETIDALEIVRQLFMENVIQSAFWHLFTMTTHSPVGMTPEIFNVDIVSATDNPFANNDLLHEDPQGCDHETFGEGLKKSLYNFMHGVCFEFTLQDWFEFEIPEPTIAPEFVTSLLHQPNKQAVTANSQIIWLGGLPRLIKKTDSHATLEFHNKQSDFELTTDNPTALWLLEILPQLTASSDKKYSFNNLSASYHSHDEGCFADFWNGHIGEKLKENGLLII